ncbi:hypothetical protein Tco_0916709 [Tanacetum coccineum]
MIITKSNGTHDFTNKADELRALPGYVLGAPQVQVPEDDLNDLKWTREEDKEVLLGSESLEILDSTLLDLLLEPTLVMSLSFPELMLLGGVFLAILVESGFLGGTTLMEVILVKGYLFPSTVKVRPVEDFDLLELLELITPVEGNKGVTAINFSLCLLKLGYVALT